MDELHAVSPHPNISVAFFTPILISGGNCLKAHIHELKYRSVKRNQFYEFHSISQSFQPSVKYFKLGCDRFLSYSSRFTIHCII